ncbi:hypothetical protein ABW19_dt0200839 [Dactylella cylindrospora]|nr:hypothetical protein ABW19_dt0200839 [Dactylella cylindrospora]
MSQDRLSNDEFFTKLTELLLSKKDHGSVYLTQKRLSYDPTSPPPTKTLTRPSKVTKPTKKKSPSSSSTKFTKNVYPTPTPEDLKADLLSLLSSPATSDPSKPSPAAGPEPLETPLPVLIRATNGKSNDPKHEGKRVKLSTVVEADQLEGFFARYAEVCKQGLTGLKKKVRKGKKSKKAKKK